MHMLGAISMLCNTLLRDCHISLRYTLAEGDSLTGSSADGRLLIFLKLNIEWQSMQKHNSKQCCQLQSMLKLQTSQLSNRQKENGQETSILTTLTKSEETDSMSVPKCNFITITITAMWHLHDTHSLNGLFAKTTCMSQCQKRKPLPLVYYLTVCPGQDTRCL